MQARQDRHDHRQVHRPLRKKHRGLPQVRPNAQRPGRGGVKET